MVDKKVKPLFTYIGGKGWLKEHLRAEIDSVLSKHPLSTYVEPFSGGLGAFLNIYDVLQKHNLKNVVLNDINEKLINFYKHVATQPELLVETYMLIEQEYEKTIPASAYLLHKTREKDTLKPLLKNTEQFFKSIRVKFNTETNELNRSACLLFLQNHCFNGVYRENSKGEYNTPFNWECKVFKKEAILEKVLAVSEVFKTFDIVFSSTSFQNLEFNEDSLFYLDPPYVNEIETHENQYHKDSFDWSKQQLLIENIKNSHFIYSNHDNVRLVKEFEDHGVNFTIKKIARKNIISASNEARKTDKMELLITSNL